MFVFSSFWTNDKKSWYAAITIILVEVRSTSSLFLGQRSFKKKKKIWKIKKCNLKDLKPKNSEDVDLKSTKMMVIAAYQDFLSFVQKLEKLKKANFWSCFLIFGQTIKNLDTSL